MKRATNKEKRSWNHRILAHENNGEVFLQLHEVYYENNIPVRYTANPIKIGSETLKGIKWTLSKIQDATNKPILWAGEKFPNEFKGLDFGYTTKQILELK